MSAVATAAGRDPVVMGKPHPAMFEEVRKSHPEIDPKRTLMIGDRQDMTIAFSALTLLMHACRSQVSSVCSINDLMGFTVFFWCYQAWTSCWKSNQVKS